MVSPRISEAIPRTRVRSLAAAFGALLALSAPCHTYASPNDVIALFDALCLGTDGDAKVIERMAIAAGGKPWSKEMINLDPAAAESGGAAFFVPRGGKQYSVMATSKGACSILAQGVPANEVQRLLQANYPLNRTHRDESGPQIVTLWTVVSPSRYEGGVVMLNIAKPGFGADGALSVGFVSKIQARAMRGGR